jgi:hypothetical protein
MDEQLVPTALLTTALAARGALAALFLSSLFRKLLDITRFIHTVQQYRLVPSSLVPTAAYGIIFLELTLSLTLPFALGTILPLLATGALLLAFSFAIGINLRRGRRFDCGCGTSKSYSPITWRHVCINALFAGSAIVLAFLVHHIHLPLTPYSLLLVFGGGILGLLALHAAQLSNTLRSVKA